MGDRVWEDFAECGGDSGGYARWEGTDYMAGLRR